MQLKAFCSTSFPNRRALIQTLLVMKLTAIIILATALQVSATGNSQTITYSGKNVALTAVFKAVEKQTGYVFFFPYSSLAEARPVTLKVKNAPLEEVLKLCFEEQPFSYVIKEQTIVISTRQSQLSRYPKADLPGSAIDIRGRIVNEKGEPLQGVTVQVKGSSKVTTTDADGSFAIDLGDNEKILVISYVNMETQEVNVDGKTNVQVQLQLAENALTDIVVVGYGTQKKRDITGAIASYDAKNLDERPVLRVDQAMIGQMAGVRVKQSSGLPGRGFSVQVRGTGSISANNEPLYVIDGFPLEVSAQNTSGGFSTGNPLDNINPNDIESIQVLKDASSAAIYGSRGSNGVVLITTKKGKSGKAAISLNSYIGYNERVRKLDMLDSEGWVDRSIDIINNTWIKSGPGRTADQTTAERQAILGTTSINTNFMIDDRWLQPGHPGLTYLDWQDEFFQKGLVQNYQLSASGGNEFVKYYISGNYLNQEGITPGVTYKNYSVRANVEVQASKKLKFGLNIAPTYSIANDPGVDGKD